MSKKKKDKKCSECICAKYSPGNCVLACGYVCYLNPFNPISMGLNGKHSERKARVGEKNQ